MARVLVVEDNPTNMTLATFLLQSVGHMVLSATDAEAGLTLARAERPNLILMDIQLPGMDGLEATAQLKRDDKLKLRRLDESITYHDHCQISRRDGAQKMRASSCRISRKIFAR